MILTGSEIQIQCLENTRHGDDYGLLINPFEPEQLNPNSYDVRLSHAIKVAVPASDSARNDHPAWQRPARFDGENPTFVWKHTPLPYILRPGEFALGSTIEKVGSRKFVTCLAGKSSIGRRGLAVHQTACFGDLGFMRQWTLELWTQLPFELLPGMRIAQAYFLTPQGSIEMQYQGKYVNQEGPTPAPEA